MLILNPDLNLTMLQASRPVSIGANVTLAQFADILGELSTLTQEGFAYCKDFREHVLKIANVPVRNVSAF